ncbi:hypothetical protein RCIP0102_00208 [Klebsiella phage RCIP0102]|jgi:hypothetical protein|uniref:Phage protein n=1 Tax=Klebsiella phage RCIP0102 TaxID=3094270 RepID=A0AAX4H096_9VIRU|nr:MAG: hypothetical protein [Bacteriophage sp.]UWI30163.1 MAG: hypothetical protein [Bacteriophage sp.]WKW87552.1 hypothetical protein pzkkv4_140 [Klebsiella phage pzk-kv4]WKW88396.1 hypothetical protein pzkkv19_252 [Klebsiella phage pzk-kv19]WKW88643.1 hypothetical protein pzkkv61_70 [Klebsiella phage pzk-kv6-1]
MITHEEKRTILQLVEELSISQNNMDAELACGHDWETYQEEFRKCQLNLEQYLDGITA